MAQRSITIDARDTEWDFFSDADCRAMVGKRYPITDAHGRVIGQGEIRHASRIDKRGLRVRLTVEVPEHLAGAMATDTGEMTPVPKIVLPGLPGFPGMNGR